MIHSWLSTHFTHLKTIQWPWQKKLQARIIYSYAALFLLVLALLMLRFAMRVYTTQIEQTEHELEVEAFIAANAFEDPHSDYAADFALLEQSQQQIEGIATSAENNRENEQENEMRETISSIKIHPISGQMRSERLQQSITKLAQSTDARVLILSAHGNLIADSDDPLLNTPNQSHQLEIKAALTGSDQHDVRLNSAGVETLFTAAPIRQGSAILGIVQLSQPMYKVLSPTRSLLGELLITGFFAMVLVTILGIWNGRRIIRPLEDLKDAAIAITGGNFQHQAPIYNNDEIGALAQAFNHMVTNLRTLLEKQRLFVANASHELRTPLFNIKLRSEALLEMDVNEQVRARRFIHEIDSEVDRLGRMANNLLDLSQIEMSPTTATTPLQAIDIAPVMLLIAQSMRMRIRQAGLSFMARIPEQMPLLPLSEADVETMVLNLLDNAIKYTAPPGTIHLTLEAVDDTCQIIVQDSGTGIPAEELPHIFDRFYRTDKARSRTRGQIGIGSGAGLGLSIVKALVEHSQGEIKVESQLGIGTTFVISFPIRSSD